jgi:hypothetical protein
MTFDHRLLTIEGSFRTHFFFLWNPQSVNVSVAVEPQALLQALPSELEPAPLHRFRAWFPCARRSDNVLPWEVVTREHFYAIARKATRGIIFRELGLDKYLEYVAGVYPEVLDEARRKFKRLAGK